MSEELKPWAEALRAMWRALPGHPRRGLRVLGKAGTSPRSFEYARGRREGYAAGLAAARAIIKAHGSQLEATARESKDFVRMLAEERALVCWQIVDEIDAAAESAEEG